MSDQDDIRARVRDFAPQYHAARKDLEAMRKRFVPLILEALQTEGVKQIDVIADSGLSRDWVRRLARKHGIEPDQPPGQ